LIFVTVGTQLPFTRLIEAIDAWAQLHPGLPVRAQVGDSNLLTRHLDARKWMSTAEFEDSVRHAELIVTHAGMGTILTARRFEVPVLVMPRLVRLGEIRSDHQQATARRLEDLGLVSVAWSVDELPAKIDLLRRHGFDCQRNASARTSLLAAVRQSVLKFVNGPGCD
jgi:UDP-N-acetylglucosamine transferase subunit ALG13